MAATAPKAAPAGAKRLYLIDGMPLVYRAYFVFINNPLITSTGFNSSAVFGYTNSLLQIITTEAPTHMAVVFDVPGPTRRNREYPDYKATRQKTPEDIRDALPHVRRITEAMGIPIIAQAGVEADDVIGALTLQAEAADFETYMVTLDKDFAQLVSDRTRLYRVPRMGNDPPQIFDVAKVQERFGIERVDQVIDIIGLVGDAVDNIPGIPGVGEKTAQKLIAQFGSVEELVARTDELKGKQKEKVESYAKQALLSKRLATIDRDIEVEVDFDALECKPLDPEKVVPLFQEFEFNSMIDRIFGDGQGVAAAANARAQTPLTTLEEVEHDYRLVATDAELSELLALLERQPQLSLFPVVSGDDPKATQLVGLGVSWADGVARYVPLAAADEAQGFALDRLEPLLGNEQVAKAGHDLKRLMTVLRWHGLTVGGRILDSRLAHQLLEPEGRHDLGELAEHFLRYRPRALGEHGLTDLPRDELVEYAAERADVTQRLLAVLLDEIEQIDGLRVWEQIEVPLVPLLVEMEYAGVSVDVATLREYSLELEKEAAAHEADIYRLAGHELNLNSPKQLGEVLFEELKLVDKPKKTRTGQYTTTEQELSRLVGTHDIIRAILDYRVVQKLKSTYVDALPAAVWPATGRIHTTFNQLVAATGRMNSENPNLQNIPIRTDKGREIRRAFVAPADDLLLLTADYSQIELRIVASVTGDSGLIEAFASDTDVHAATAARVFSVELEQVTPMMRSRAKMVNFGLMYGMSAFGLSQRLNIPRKEAAEIMDRYFAQFPSIADYMKDTIAKAKRDGYVQTLMGRRRYLRDINSRNHSARGAAERIAINAPIQGTAADMIKLAMLRIDEQLQAQELRTRMILQVHDELVFEVPRDEVATIEPLVIAGMRDALPLEVPVVVETGIGDDWLQAH